MGYWIGHFDFVINYISMPLYVSLIGHTFISKMYPDQFPNLKHYTFLGALGSLPLNYKVQSSIEQKVGDKKYIWPFAKLITQTEMKNLSLGSLERQIISAMSEPTIKVKFAQYRWIKDYVKDHQISDLSLFNVYLKVLNLTEFEGIKGSERLTPSEA